MKKLIAIASLFVAFSGVSLHAQTYFQDQLPLYNGIGYYNSAFVDQPTVLKFNVLPWTIDPATNAYCFSYPWCKENGISKSTNALVGDSKYFCYDGVETNLPQNAFISINDPSLAGPWVHPAMLSVSGIYYAPVENLAFIEIYTNSPAWGLPNPNPQWNGYYQIEYYSAGSWHTYTDSSAPNGVFYQPNFDRYDYSTYPNFPSSLASPTFAPPPPPPPSDGGGGNQKPY